MTHYALIEGFVPSKKRDDGRRVWVLEPSLNPPAWTAIFLDAEIYLERVGAAAVLGRLQTAGGSTSLRSIFVSSEDTAARYTDYTCNADYADFIDGDVLSWVIGKYPRTDQSHVLLIGLSLSGLAAAHVALTKPGHFRAAICQSPSLWWNEESFKQDLPSATDSSSSFWISVGRLETEKDVSHPPSGMFQESSQIDACQRTTDALVSKGFVTNYRVFDGGHDPTCWAEDLVVALPWAIQQG